jgi:uncharacterized membrane protein YphA (DoxX/SURF4 family)
MKNQENAAWGFLVLRFGLGIDFSLHGLGRTGAGFEIFHSWVMGLFANSVLPNFLTEIAAYLIPPVEIGVGILFILGFQTKWATVCAGALMSMLIFGMASIQKWDLVAIQVLYLVAFFLLLTFLENDQFSVDGYRQRKISKH